MDQALLATLNMEILNQTDLLKFKKEEDIEIIDEGISNIKDEQPYLNNVKVGSECGEESDDSFNVYDNAELEENIDCLEYSDEQEESAGNTKEYGHKCPNCDKSFMYRSYMLKHKRRIHEHVKVKRKCRFCDLRVVEVTKHMNKMHDDRKTLKCALCDSRFFYQSLLKKHMVKHKRDEGVKNAGNTKDYRHECLNCDESFKYRSYLLKHKSRVHGEHVKVKRKCRFCHLRVVELSKHMYKMHVDRKTFKCALCDSRFFYQSDLKKHMVKHKGDEDVKNAGNTKNYRHKCPNCDETFTNYSYMLRHNSRVHVKVKIKCPHCDLKVVQVYTHMNKMHEDCKTFQCPVCDSRFFYKSVLKEHMVKHVDVKSHICNVCGKGYSRAGDLIRHHDTTHTEERPFLCTLCIKSFRIKQEWKVHMKIHTRELMFKCDMCSKEFISKSSLREHLLTHSEEKLYKCDKCGNAYKNQVSLRRHKIVHSKEPKFACKLCEKVFVQISELRRHEMVHSEGRPYPCSLCDKRFPNKRSLKIHMNTHTRQVTFKCDVCSKEFVSKTNLPKHMRTHTGERPHVCKVCGKAYSKAYSLRLHNASNHPEISNIKKEAPNVNNSKEV